MTDVNDSELQDTLDDLLDAGNHLPPGTKNTLLGRDGAEVVDALIEIVADEELAEPDARGDGYAPVHATAILVERAEQAAIAPLAERLRSLEPQAVLQDHIVRGLGEFGGRAVDPVLDVYEEAAADEDLAAMVSLLDAAFETGASPERLDEAMVTLARYEPEFLGLLLPEYDAADRVVARLEDLAEEFAAADPDDRPHDEILRGLAATIEDFGGRAPPELRD